jgi:ketosteroid isomerase-like protein
MSMFAIGGRLRYPNTHLEPHDMANHRHGFLALVAPLIVAACTSHHFDAASESSALLKRDADWADVASRGEDVDKIVSYWSDDAVVIPQGQPIAEGKQAIRAFVVESLKTPGFKIHWVSRSVNFSPDGNLAFIRSENEITVAGADGAPVKMTGRGITVWRRDGGEWFCVVDIWNDPPKESQT